MLVIADGSDGCYDLGGERDDEREEERRRGDATTVTGPGATPVGTLTRRALQSRPGFGSERAILGFYFHLKNVAMFPFTMTFLHKLSEMNTKPKS